ncbi:sigma-70 family RNA polymerase sigma factor [Pedobacter montanisoli]|uniref:Sigma-70 family RNA polymerase sigma factor n=1 Tax=Pedobacter montanisoli TaxID=2923277 RepID=A0ABS9ZWA1_9SPHI|nr:sigma-70 family RNA polymerase sigma factor [Pedobacter montanisoli]MCJ0742588.1 sigma-70 family RNA polymerase sigma factor [Pedobacter montanisoli]
MSLTAIHNEATILSQIADGNEEAFRKLFMAYHNQLAEHVYFLTHSKEVTEEIVHDVFVKIWTNRQDLDQIEKFTAYLFIICRNHTLNTLRKIAKTQQADSVYKNEQLNSWGTNEIDYGDFDELLGKSIDLLPSQQQQVFKYRMKGIKNPEIATKMGISTESVRKYYKLALTALVKHVKMHQSLITLLTLLLHTENLVN